MPIKVVESLFWSRPRNQVYNSASFLFSFKLMKPGEYSLDIHYSKVRLSATLHYVNLKSLVILSHGFTGSKVEGGRSFVSTARALAKAKISALRFDFMGSGDSSGEFYDMSPESEIRDLKNVIQWAQKKGFKKIGLLGQSFGGGVTICTAAQTKVGALKTIVTWSSVPSFKFWRPTPDEALDPKKENPMLKVGPSFYTDRPKVDVPEAYLSLTLPKLQIQGDQDIPGFREEFSKYFPKAQGVKKHIVIPTADHVFTHWPHRKQVISKTVQWFSKYLNE
ncbi:MAG: alpha/beta fold hydrolase [Verrucomicrobiota bacterium]